MNMTWFKVFQFQLSGFTNQNKKTHEQTTTMDYDKSQTAQDFIWDAENFELDDNMGTETFLEPLPWAHLAKEELTNLYGLVNETGKINLLCTTLVWRLGFRDELLCPALYHRVHEAVFQVPETFDAWPTRRIEPREEERLTPKYYDEDFIEEKLAELTQLKVVLKKEEEDFVQKFPASSIYELADAIADFVIEPFAFLAKKQREKVRYTVRDCFMHFVAAPVLSEGETITPAIAVEVVRSLYFSSPFSYGELTEALAARRVYRSRCKTCQPKEKDKKNKTDRDASPVRN